MSNTFAAGSRAFGFCDLCAFRYPLKDLRNLTVKTKVTSTRACPACWSEDHPQLMVGMYPVNDPQALRDPRPDTGMADSRTMLVPVYNFVAGGYTSASTAVGLTIIA